jgi:hypothetical protein
MSIICVRDAREDTARAIDVGEGRQAYVSAPVVVFVAIAKGI